jgi:hypothetical protein
MRVVMKKGAPTPVRESGAPLLVAILIKYLRLNHGVLKLFSLHCSHHTKIEKTAFPEGVSDF